MKRSFYSLFVAGFDSTKTGPRRASTENLGLVSIWPTSDARGHSQEVSSPPRPQSHMFNDTTRLRLMSRPSLKDALQSFSGQPGAGGSTKLGRIGVSQSFREKMTPPMRPREPPPPPPLIQLANDGTNSGSSYSLAKKFFSFNKTEIRRINRFLGIGESDPRTDTNIYDIAENDEQSSDIGVTVVDNSKFYTSSLVSTTCPGPEPQVSRPGAGVKKNVSLRLRPKSNEFSAVSVVDPVKPPRAKRERSKSFTPRSNPLVKTSLFNRSLSHIPKSASNSSLNGKSGVISGDNSKKVVITNNVSNDEANEAKRTLSSSDLVTIFPDEERRSFKDIRKILSSPSISSSCSSSTNQIYRPKSQLSNSSSVINNSIKEEQIVVSAKAKEAFVEHIYEEIRDKDVVDNVSQCKRPLPPLPSEKQPSPSRSSPIISDPSSSPIKSIFEGASKYDILNYLEDARERGLTDCDLDDMEEEEEEAETETNHHDTALDDSAAAAVILSVRNHNVHSNRISNISTQSSDSCESGETSEDHIVIAKEKLSSVEIERNDSGLGSETGRGRSISKVVVRKRSDQETEDLSCIDCDQVLENVEKDK